MSPTLNYYSIIILPNNLLSIYTAELLVLSGGYGNPNISVIDSDGGECTNVQFPEIPQEIGQKGRIGSFMGSFGSKMVVCGGQCGKSILCKDCKMIDVLSGYIELPYEYFINQFWHCKCYNFSLK